MATTQIFMPAMGESIFECKVLGWLVSEGDEVDVDDMILEVATDKIDTEIGSSHKGIITKFLVEIDQIVSIGSPICEIEVEGEIIEDPSLEIAAELESEISSISESISYEPKVKSESRFYSPLVLNIAREEGIPQQELDAIPGTGMEGRVTKKDMLSFIKGRQSKRKFELPTHTFETGEDTIQEMDRMRQMIAARMLESQRISAHVTSFMENDMTGIVKWRDENKNQFFADYGIKLTFTPLLIEAVVKAIQKYQGINIQIDGTKVIQKADINIGMAVALPDGNLIVPVIHHADQMSLKELTFKTADLAKRARNNALKPDELSGGTYTISNIGTFGNLMGTPIIMQPQVAIMAFGAIVKKPAVLETEMGDVIAVRQKMFISHSYDHRVIDGSLGGLFLKEVSDQLENFDIRRKI